MKTMRIKLLGAFLLPVLILGARPSEVLGGIRLDGTEFQNSSNIGTTTQKSAQIQTSKIVFTFGQAVMATGKLPAGAAETAVQIGLGYEYNVVHTTLFGCSCPHQGDADKDGYGTSLDLAALIDALFAGGTNPQDGSCPTLRFDADCDGYVSPLDLAVAVDFLYAQGPPACNPCTSEMWQ